MTSCLVGCEELEYRYAALQASNDLVLANQDSIGSKFLTFSATCLASWVVNLPANIVFVTTLYIAVHFYFWFTRRRFFDNFWLDALAKWTLCLFYPIMYLVLVILVFKDIDGIRHMRERPQPTATAEGITVSHT